MKYIIFTALFSTLLVSNADAARTEGNEYERFGRLIVAALSDGDAEAFSQAIDKEAMLDRVFEGMSRDSKTMSELRTGLNRGLDRVGEIVTRNLGENALLTFVRHRHMNDGNYALVRIDFGEKGLNYLDFVLRKDRTGSVKIVDWHDYSQGQLYTTSVRQAIVLVVPQERSLFEKLLGVNKLNKKEARQFVELARLQSEQNYAGWLKKYNGVSDKLKYSRILLVTRTLIASAMGDGDRYRLALGDIHEHLGDDPTLSLVLIDYYFYEEDYEAAHEALESLAEYTGGDAAIDHLRANVYLVAENYPESIRFAQTAIEQDAAYEDAYWTLLDASVLAEQYQIAVSTIRKLENHFGYEFDPARLAKAEGFEGFAESDAFAKWKDIQQEAKNNSLRFPD